MPVSAPILVWFRRNLRIDDNLVLREAVRRGGPVIPVFIRQRTANGVATASGAWLDRSLNKFARELSRKGSRLVARSGDPLEVLKKLIKETEAAAVLWDKSFEPIQRETDDRICAQLTRSGVLCSMINDALLFDPGRILNKQETPFKVFTPFWNHCLSLGEPPEPQPCPRLISPSKWPRSEELRVKIPKWAKKIEHGWKPGSDGARQALKRFLDGRIENYPVDRDRPFLEGTSRLSSHLHFGEISARQVWHETRKHAGTARLPGSARASEAFLRQIIWREFAHYLLFHFPETADKPLRKEFLRLKWKKDAKLLRAWQKGKTGYPIVDAGMRELWSTGWMHNRVRMIVGSFLVKDLLQDWRDGASWFMETLADADLANNTFGWQWVAGCGADAAPYFRIFNPVLQGEKFDPEGAYVKQWVPELSKVPAKFIHGPWQAPADVLAKAGVRLGKDYPAPVVDHDAARKKALFSYYRLKKSPSKY
jgi:deoxyribodipyrimidine photo-lyase